MDSDCCCEELMINLNLLSTWHFDHRLPRSSNHVFRNEHSYFGLRFKVVLGRAIKCKQKSETSANTSSKHSTGNHFRSKYFSHFWGFCVFSKICVFCSFYRLRQSFIRRYSGSYKVKGDISQIFACNKLQFVKISLVTPSMITCLKGVLQFLLDPGVPGSDLWARLSLTE